ncbi:MAG: hypothetical protein V1709_09170 [Planctomycetota bacterium]
MSDFTEKGLLYLKYCSAIEKAKEEFINYIEVLWGKRINHYIGTNDDYFYISLKDGYSLWFKTDKNNILLGMTLYDIPSKVVLFLKKRKQGNLEITRKKKWTRYEYEEKIKFKSIKDYLPEFISMMKELSSKK